MDDLTRERYGPLTERDLWAELHPGVRMPQPLADAARAKRNRDRKREDAVSHLGEEMAA